MRSDVELGGSRPVFKVCPRCQYSLRGLPANHACPECGLQYDERCELYRVAHPRRLLVFWIGIFVSGIGVLQHLPKVASFGSISGWDRLGAMAAVGWFFFIGLMTWVLIKHFRRGFNVAVTGDGLLIHLPAFGEDLIPWEQIGEASVKEKASPDKPQTAIVHINGKPKSVGVPSDVFPNRATVERFVKQVNERVRMARSAAEQAGDQERTAST